MPAYDIEFRPTAKHANDDSLSRLPIDNISTAKVDDSACLFNIHRIGTLPVDPKQLHLETANDPVLSSLEVYKSGVATRGGCRVAPIL